MNENKIYSFIGLATKAGKTVTGQELVEKAVKTRKADLVIVAVDASENTKKAVRDCCLYYDAKLLVFGEKHLLGKYTGKDARASVAICDKGFATRLIEMIESEIA